MTYSQELLNDLKAAKDGCSYNAASKFIGCSRQFVSEVKDGKKNFSPENVIAIAVETGKDPLETLLNRLLEGSDNPKVRQTIEEIRQQIQ